MGKIQLLPDSVANQIAAGEVIQRPASVIKELVENSVDAGATIINVLIVNAGKTSIQVIDNGAGMSVTDARLAFERHATSKIRKADDLFSLHTMGFRGEALPSIASVAQVTLRTRRAEDALGTCLHIEGGKFTSQTEDTCPQGSNFLVENLFFNVPVRRKFLKTNATELNNIITAFQRIVLVYPEIEFTLHHNGQKVMDLHASSIHQRIVDIFGKKLNQTLIPINVETSLGAVRGFVGTPESSHKKNLQQYFFVNGRFMKHGAFHKAVMSAYDRLIPQGNQVPYFIYFDVRPEDIDVNIHPTKTEIKFQDEASVWQILFAAVREAIGKNSQIPSIDFDTEGRPDLPIFGGDDTPSVDVGSTPDVPPINFDPQYNPFKTSGDNNRKTKTTQVKSVQSDSRRSSGAGVVPSNWQMLYEGLDDDKDSNNVASDTSEQTLFEQTSQFISDDMLADAESALAAPFADRSSTHLQYKGAYILTSVNEGLLVTDQERAHERILFEQYLAEMESTKHASQKILFPEAVQFTLAEMISLPEIIPEMERLGFELNDIGGGAYAINAVPAGLEGVNAVRLVNEMVSSAVENMEGGTHTDTRRELYTSLAMSMAANAAIPHGQVLSNDEMEKLISSLLSCENSRYTPKGRPIYRVVPHGQIVF